MKSRAATGFDGFGRKSHSAFSATSEIGDITFEQDDKGTFNFIRFQLSLPVYHRLRSFDNDMTQESSFKKGVAIKQNGMGLMSNPSTRDLLS